jgi:DNA-binding IclR family transcriptional regulator
MQRIPDKDVLSGRLGLASDADRVVKSGLRAVQVLEFFRNRGSPARAIDIGRQLLMSPSSARDLLKTLAEIGYLEFDERSKHYYIGARAAMFGHWAAGVNPSVGKLEGFARALYQRASETVILSTYCRGAMLLLTVIQAEDVTLPSFIKAGHAAPLLETAAGGAVLMNMAREERSEVVKRLYHLKKIDKAASKLLQRINDFKEQAYAVSTNDKLLPGFSALAVPLPCKISFHPIVVSVCGPKLKIKQREKDLAAIAQKAIVDHFGVGGATCKTKAAGRGRGHNIPDYYRSEPGFWLESDWA